MIVKRMLIIAIQSKNHQKAIGENYFQSFKFLRFGVKDTKIDILFTVECWNPNVQNPNNVEIPTIDR